MADVAENRWQGHPALSRAIRIAIFVVPFVTAMAVAFVLSARLPLVDGTAMRIVRWLGIVAVSTLAMTVVDRLARRVLPLSALLNLTLIFPDQAPSRFRIAMRTGTTNQLRQRLDDARTARVDETPAEAAERLLELVGLLSQHDRLTRGHSERVRAYTHLIGSEMGLTEAELDKIRWAGLLHDVGKTSIASEILNKPGRLTDDEFETIKTHPMEGRSLVEPLADWLGESLRAVWEHHERFDGNGYPQGLSGLDISLAARIVTVADCYDVMTSARSYKQPMSSEAARAELARCSGTQFDPTVVRAFLSISLGKLRLMTGPAAWFAQLALFEPSGVVHANGPAPLANTTTSATSGAAGGSTTAAATGTAVSSSAGSVVATAGTSGFVSAATAVTASVAVSTAGIAVAAPVNQNDTNVVTSPVVSVPSDVEAVELDEPSVTIYDLATGRLTTAAAPTTVDDGDERPTSEDDLDDLDVDLDPVPTELSGNPTTIPSTVAPTVPVRRSADDGAASSPTSAPSATPTPSPSPTPSVPAVNPPASTPAVPAPVPPGGTATPSGSDVPITTPATGSDDHPSTAGNGNQGNGNHGNGNQGHGNQGNGNPGGNESGSQGNANGNATPTGNGNATEVTGTSNPGTGAGNPGTGSQGSGSQGSGSQGSGNDSQGHGNGGQGGNGNQGAGNGNGDGGPSATAAVSVPAPATNPPPPKSTPAFVADAGG